MLEQRAIAPESIFGYQMHQVAIFTDHAQAAVDKWKSFGHTEWAEDKAVLVGKLDGIEGTIFTYAHMWFNYDIMPMELEFLEYTGHNRHAAEGRDGAQPFISHMSTYVDNVFIEAMKMQIHFNMLPYHRFVTTNHQNPHVLGKKRFIECIYDTRELLGYDIKLINKVPWDFPNQLWIDWEIEDFHTAEEWAEADGALMFPKQEEIFENVINNTLAGFDIGGKKIAD